MSIDQKTEKQKMLAGELYLASDSELAIESKRAARLIHSYNQTTVDEPERRLQIIQELFGGVGVNPSIVPPFRLDWGWGYHLSGGDYWRQYHHWGG